MENRIKQRIEEWKKLLLDFSKRNRLYNFRPTKRTSLKITTPDFAELFHWIVEKEETLQFPHTSDDEDEDGKDVVLMKVKTRSRSQYEIETGAESIAEQQKSLQVLRLRAKRSYEEQGVNILYLIFGLLKWKPKPDVEEELVSPLLLVPVRLQRANLAVPYKLCLNDSEDIVLNPTLKHKLYIDHNIDLSDFDSEKDNLEEFFTRIEKKVNSLGSVDTCVYMTLLSFAKMSMYEDLNRNEEKLCANPHVQALCEEPACFGDDWDLDNYDHDNKTQPKEIFQILDADSSQMDAILAAKNGRSFVLQGPPGTGKSQTIANIIAESLAVDKTVLFVSEKRAALEVVYKRLQSAGLGDFCFALHDHKANRRQILSQLEVAMEGGDKTTASPDTDSLTQLQQIRTHLNRYCVDLHTPCSEYNKSVFQIIGELAKLSDVPLVLFDIPDVSRITSEYIEEKKKLLQVLADIIEKSSDAFDNNCWKHTVVERYTQALGYEIDARLRPLSTKLRELGQALQELHSEYENDIGYTVRDLQAHKDILKIASESPLVPDHWVKSDCISALSQATVKWEELINTIQRITRDLEKSYNSDFFSLPASDYCQFLHSGIEYLSGFFKVDDKDAFVASLEKFIEEIASIKEALEDINGAAENTADSLGLEHPLTRKELLRLKELCNELQELPAIPHAWFNPDTFAHVKAVTPKRARNFGDLKKIESQILQDFDREIFDLEYEPLLLRFRTEYNSAFKWCKPSYHKDMKIIRAYYRNTTSLKSKEIHDLLNSLKLRNELQKQIEQNKEELSVQYGTLYTGKATNWQIIEKVANAFSKIATQWLSMPERFRDMLQNGRIPQDKVTQFLQVYNLHVPVRLYTRVNEICKFSIELDQKYSHYSRIFDQIISFAKLFLDTYSGIEVTRNVPASFTQIVQDLENLNTLNKYSQELEENKSDLAQHYGRCYSGLSTDWNLIRSGLSYSSQLREIVQKYNLNPKFVTAICSNLSAVKNCEIVLQQVNNIEREISLDLKWFADLFPVGMERDMYCMDISSLADKVASCQQNKKLLEEWIDYQVARRHCIDADLSSYLQVAEEQNVSAQYIVNAYLKRFYVLWIDAMKSQFPALEDFRDFRHEKRIDLFKELDLTQLQIAQQKIQRKLKRKLPDIKSKYSNNSEVRILRRELLKKQRLKPLRRLFSEIPNLVMNLKPCFMMSPLSASVFLGSDAYVFDVVIFDEASQVFTEDAIGAIMRGKQVIIVGDDKQLPPTSFFKVTMTEEEYDDDEPEIKDGELSSAAEKPPVYESILTEAVGCGFHRHSLRWHYRSRHEDLITFSNVKLYDRNLITFPSTMERMPGFGVEFIHVANGCYDRTKSKGVNLVEARKVADLVFEHFRQFGANRSLGVVAFSESQQEAIEAAIMAKRRMNDAYESYFNEDVEEAFFVKNLENVQGDERDTIIFSVGYARDAAGKINMNFGPLSRVGGERRLNVAVTRAKYNVKLVASILPSDIDLDRAKSYGVRLLRSYIEFAQQGVSALSEKNADGSSMPEHDSPFEKAVYDYLTSKGYQVKTQVGCSGYRIDMAVKHPHLHGKYAIAIECDGATYHSSRTARERDRLRQTILEDMGWTVYRIWSTDWIKTPEIQQSKLVRAIDAAIKKCTDLAPAENSYTNNQIDVSDNNTNYVFDDFNEDSVTSTKLDGENELLESMPTPEYQVVQQVLPLDDVVVKDVNDYGFSKYECTILDSNWEAKDIPIAIAKVVGVEQPIHVYELAKRLLTLYGRQKMTDAFIREVERDLKCLPSSYQITNKRQILQYKAFNSYKVRIPGADGYVRDVEHIPDKEIELAFTTIVGRNGSITKKELIRKVANAFGFKRISDKINKPFDRILMRLIKKYVFKESRGRVRLT